MRSRLRMVAGCPALLTIFIGCQVSDCHSGYRKRYYADFHSIQNKRLLVALGQILFQCRSLLVAGCRDADLACRSSRDLFCLLWCCARPIRLRIIFRSHWNGTWWYLAKRWVYLCWVHLPFWLIDMRGWEEMSVEGTKSKYFMRYLHDIRSPLGEIAIVSSGYWEGWGVRGEGFLLNYIIMPGDMQDKFTREATRKRCG